MSKMSGLEYMVKQEVAVSGKLTLGKYYQKIRELRAYTYADIETVYLHSSQLSRFEKGKSMFSVDCWLLAIQGLNMTPTDFFMMMPNQKHSKFQEVFTELQSCKLERNLEKLNTLLQVEPKNRMEQL